jgi:ubiquinone biosynthesis protein UbiJ
VFQLGTGGRPPAGCEPTPSLFAASAADGLGASYELRLGEQRFGVRVAEGRLEVARGSAEAPDATIETDPGTLATVLWHGRELDEARRAGDVAITGDRRAVTRFLRLFPLPDGARADAASG